MSHSSSCPAAILLLLATTGLATPARAQDGGHPARPDETRVGIGLSIDVLGSLFALGYYEDYASYANYLGDPRVRIPIQLSNGLRIEPEVGFTAFTDDDSTSSTIGLGAAVAPTWKVGPNVSAYGGGRAGVVRSSSAYEGEGETSTDISIAGIIGGEYWIGNHFTIGAEGWLGLTKLDGEDGMLSGTGGDMLLRLYLN